MKQTEKAGTCEIVYRQTHLGSTCHSADCTSSLAEAETRRTDLAQLPPPSDSRVHDRAIEESDPSDGQLFSQERI